jgi:hypothetical protein
VLVVFAGFRVWLFVLVCACNPFLVVTICTADAAAARLERERTNKCGKDSDIATCPQHYMVGSPLNMDLA